MPSHSLSKTLAATLTAVVLIAGPAAAQDLGHKAPPQAKPIAIVGGRIVPVAGPPIEGGYVLFDRGLIREVGTLPRAGGFDSSIEQVDAVGKFVYPGLIAPYTQVGLTEIAAVRATLDMSEIGQASPEVRAGVSVNPDSTLIPVTRTNGVLVAGIFPTTTFSSMAYFNSPGGLVPGRASVMRLDGWTWEDMTVLDDAGLSINWPQPRPITAWWMDKSEEDQQRDIDRSLAVVEDLITGAKRYASSKSADASLPTDLRFEAMRGLFAPTANGPANAPANATQKPVFISANDVDQITQAVGFCQKHGLKCVIVGGFDAPLCLDLLKRHDIPVLLSGAYRFPKRDDSPYDQPFTLAATLQSAGIRWTMASGEEASNERNLAYSVALAVAHGLPREAALRAITLSAAQILGVSKSLGSIEPGKSATLIIADGDVLEVTTNINAAWIDGRRIDLRNKQTELEAKYREKYRQIGQPH